VQDGARQGAFGGNRQSLTFHTARNGGTASASGDTGTWMATAISITANSSKSGVHVYRLENRNSPQE